MDAQKKFLRQISSGFEELSGGKSVQFYQGAPWDFNTIVITSGHIHKYTSLYFSSYHCLYPVLDEDYFRHETITKAGHSNFAQDNQDTTLLLLVMALGEVAEQAVTGEPMYDQNTKRETGVRGGDRTSPPGIAYIMEARKRIGQGMTKMDLTVLHCYILFALYYAQVSRNMDYYRMTRIASDLCHALAICVDDWKTFMGDMTNRAYWMCILLEGGLHTELGIPPTGLRDIEPEFPLFLRSQYAETEELTPRDLAIKFTFMAQITLRSQLNSIGDTVKSFDGTPASAHNSLPTRNVTSALITGLSNWRRAIPPDISWSDDDTPKLTPQPSGINSLYPPPTTPNPSDERQELDHLHALWNYDKPYHSTNKIVLPYNSTNFVHIEIVLQAALRTRWKYAQYLIWRPYLYKVLHSTPNSSNPNTPSSHSHSGPNNKKQQHGRDREREFPQPAPPPHAQDIPITTDDVIGALKALEACTLWHLRHPVFKDQRRLLPHLYEYSHSMFGILLVFAASERSAVMLSAFEAAERGPAPSPYPSTYSPSLPSSSSSPFATGAASQFGAPLHPAFNHSNTTNQPTTDTARIRQSIAELGRSGQLEEWRHLREQMGISKECFLGWLADMQIVHPIANWCWPTLRKVYGLEGKGSVGKEI